MLCPAHTLLHLFLVRDRQCRAESQRSLRLLRRRLVKLPVTLGDFSHIYAPFGLRPGASHQAQLLEATGLGDRLSRVSFACDIGRRRCLEHGHNRLNLAFVLPKILSMIAQQ